MAQKTEDDGSLGEPPGGLTRRSLMAAGAAFALAAAGSPARAAPRVALRYGDPEAFSFDRLAAAARDLAARPFVPTPVRYADQLEAVDYDAYQKIRFRPEASAFLDGAYPVQFFHPGRYFKQPVRMYRVDRGRAREILFDPDLFVYGDSPALAGLPRDLGFAGFRVMGRGGDDDWLAFLGAAYFRSCGELNQYGLSARGLAIDVALPTPEEFPRFTGFWFEEPRGGSGRVVIYALMDSPSVAGAFRLTCTRNRIVTTDVSAALFPRTDIKRFGIAPLTSMFWYSTSSRRTAWDWRPQIHDSDGLALWTGAGERIWRPLNNPPDVQTSTFFDQSPKGFGLLQRERRFDQYEDDGVFYDRRPTAWIEPKGDWGRGAVQLVEIPTDDEVHDNVVAYWLPEKPALAGSEWSFDYRLTWTANEPFPPHLGRVVATRVGIGGIPGQSPHPVGRKKFVVDFAGGPLDALKRTDKVKPVVTLPRGQPINPYALQVVGTKTWRAFFDVQVAGADPSDLRLYLALDGKPLTETWLFQFIPAALG
jgi:glucans biosynthesis protein